MLPILLKDHLIDLGVIIIGDILAFIRHAKSLFQPSSEATQQPLLAQFSPRPNVLNLLRILLNMLKHLN